MKNLSNSITMDNNDIYNYNLNKNIFDKKHIFTTFEGHRYGDWFYNGDSNNIIMSAKKQKNRSIKHRFLVSIYLAIFIMFSIVALNSYLGTTNSVGATTNEYTEITVVKGDTMWNIAGEYKSKTSDLKQAIYELCKLNNIRADELKPGMKLKVPKGL